MTGHPTSGPGTTGRAVAGRVATAQRRREIVAAAATLFDRFGYAQTTMEAIAAAVGIAKPTLYHHFASKHDILSAIHEEFIKQLIDQQRARSGLGLRPDQMLLEVIADILELMETHRGYVRVFFEHHRELPDDVRAAVTAERDRYQAMVEDVIRAGIADGSLRSTEPTLAALALFGMCNWAYQWYMPGGRLRYRQVAYEFWSYLVYGLASRPTDGPAADAAASQATDGPAGPLVTPD